MDIYYVDTLVWRDYHENRTDKFRPLGEWAFDFFKKVLNEKDTILYSYFVEIELKKDYNEQEIEKIFEIIKKHDLLKKIEINELQLKESRKISRERNLPFGDVIHAILARDNSAVIVTRDHHFEELQDIAICKKPEELL